VGSSAETPLFGMGGVADPKITLLPTRVVLQNLVLCQTVRALLTRSVWIIWPLASSLSRSLKVIGIDTDRYLPPITSY